VEKTLIDQLGLHYQHAHQIATRAEEAAVRADRVSWRAYDRFMQKYVKEMGDERLTRVPENLDLKPYRDEHDVDLLKSMAASIEAGAAGRLKPGGKVHKAILDQIAHAPSRAPPSRRKPRKTSRK
jgi:hypothetical protein